MLGIFILCECKNFDVVFWRIMSRVTDSMSTESMNCVECSANICEKFSMRKLNLINFIFYRTPLIVHGEE